MHNRGYTLKLRRLESQCWACIIGDLMFLKLRERGKCPCPPLSRFPFLRYSLQIYSLQSIIHKTPTISFYSPVIYIEPRRWIKILGKNKSWWSGSAEFIGPGSGPRGAAAYPRTHPRSPAELLREGSCVSPSVSCYKTKPAPLLSPGADCPPGRLFPTLLV